MRKIIIALLSITIIFATTSCSKEKVVKVEEIYEYVYDAGEYTKLDYDNSSKFYAQQYDNWGGGCSAIAKTLANGQTIVGRNMDLNISNKCAYVIRTNVKDCYPTIGLAYTFRDFSPNYNEVKQKGGIGEDFHKILPFMCDDVLNSEGLYIEINMRNGEFWPTGDAKFSCKGTNPDSNERVYMFEIPRYVGEHCATVDEAIEYINTLDVYSKEGYWNYCFLIADATGHYGVMEFANDSAIWHDYQPAQTNFYIDEELNSIEELKCGVGRYNLLMENIDSVNSEDDMFNLMNRVTYYQVYDVDNCEFDWRSEDVGVLPFASYDFVTAEEYQEAIYEAAKLNGQQIRSMTREQQQVQNEYWESSFTEVINCNERTLFVRFFENDSKTLKLGFDK